MLIDSQFRGPVSGIVLSASDVSTRWRIFSLRLLKMTSEGKRERKNSRRGVVPHLEDGADV